MRAAYIAKLFLAEKLSSSILSFLLMNGDDDQQQGGSEYDEDDVFEPKEDDLVNWGTEMMTEIIKTSHKGWRKQ